MLAAQLLDGGDYAASYSLEAVAERYLDEALDKSERRTDWSGELSEAAARVRCTRRCRPAAPARAAGGGCSKRRSLGRISGIEFGAVAALAEMELAGIKLDVARWKELEMTVRKRRD